MDLRQLRYFVGIVQAGSLSRAADQMHVAQSAISHHLASLESELGRQLVTRGPKGILLTEAGGVLYRHAEAILRQVEFAKQDALSAQNVPSGRVSIGFPVALASLLGYELLVRIRETYPQILLHLTDANSALLRERLLNGRLDMAVLLIEQPERGLAVEPLVVEELFYVSAAGDNSPIRLAEAAKFPMLVPGPGSGIQRAVQEAFNKQGLTVTPIGECDTMNTLRRLVASGIGNSIMTWCAVHDGDPQIVAQSPQVCRRQAGAHRLALLFRGRAAQSRDRGGGADVEDAGARIDRKRRLAGRHAGRTWRRAVQSAGPQWRVKAGHRRTAAQLQAGRPS